MGEDIIFTNKWKYKETNGCVQTAYYTWCDVKYGVSGPWETWMLQQNLKELPPPLTLLLSFVEARPLPSPPSRRNILCAFLEVTLSAHTVFNPVHFFFS